MQDPVLEVMDAGVFDSSSGIIIWQNDSAKSIFGNFFREKYRRNYRSLYMEIYIRKA